MHDSVFLKGETSRTGVLKILFVLEMNEVNKYFLRIFFGLQIAKCLICTVLQTTDM